MYFKQSLLASALSLSMIGAVTAAPNWPNVPYSYYAKQEELPTLLREFASGFSLALQLGPRVQGVVNGKFNSNSPTEFLNRLGGVYGLNWFVYAGTLFVSRSNDMKTRSINAMGTPISAVREALQQLGVLDSRFGWGELPDQGIALVSGPPSYVDLVERTVAALPIGSSGQEVVVFKLKHATVNDRTITYRDQSMVTPGLATVLRNLITGDVSAIAKDSSLSAMAAPLRESPPIFPVDSKGAVADVAKASADTKPTKSNRGSLGRSLWEPTVQADTRLNAIIVQDIPDRMPIYRNLIEQLDVPSTLIEIDAMIVDVNSELVRSLGVNWGVLNGDTSIGYGDLSLAPNPSRTLPIDSAGGIAAGTIGLSVGSSLAARINALQKEGQASILSQPSILTTDNMGAIIDLSDTFYVQTTGERVATVTPITAGTSLRVTPRYIEGSNGARVELTIDIEDGKIQSEQMIDSLPRVRRSNISTLAVVNDDQTLLIGGYNSSQDSEGVQKVPLLGDLPLIGSLFSYRSKTLERRERLFLIRPRVVAINGKPVAQSWVENSVTILNATWGDKHPMMGGRSLELVDNEKTKLIRTPSNGVSGTTGPINVGNYFSKDIPF
jgi:type III secretion protein C